MKLEGKEEEGSLVLGVPRIDSWLYHLHGKLGNARNLIYKRKRSAPPVTDACPAPYYGGCGDLHNDTLSFTCRISIFSYIFI